jgi:hypothetical protein
MTQIVKDKAVTKWLPREYQLVPKLATHEGHPPAHARTTYGAYATHLFTFLGEDATRYWVPHPSRRCS